MKFHWYFKIFNYLAEHRIKLQDVDLRRVHFHVAMVFSTGILMWAYALLAALTISSPIPGIVGFVCALTHLLSIFLIRISNRIFLISNIAISAGFIHQGTFSYFTGGFDSQILHWFALLPMLSGIINGRKGAITWLIITMVGTLIFLIFDVMGYPFPFVISAQGYLWASLFLYFGWITLSFVMILVFVKMMEDSENLLKQQGQKIDDLFRVLFHDLANSLGRLGIGISIGRKQENHPQTERGLQIAHDALDSMVEITQNVRRMYAVSKGKAEVDLSLCSLNEAVFYVQKVFQPELDKKQLSIEYDFEKNKGIHLWAENISFKNQVLGNILSNAIKFSHPGGKILINAYPINRNYYAVEIKDFGMGMPKEIITHLFDINKKTSRAGTKGESGTGFGMHIMKSFIEIYGGQVLVDSTEASSDNASGFTTFKLILKGEVR